MPAAPAAPQSTADAMQQAFAEALKQEGVVKDEGKSAAEVTAPPAETTTTAVDKTSTTPAPAATKDWDKLIEEKAALRRQQEALKSNPQLALHGSIDAGSAQALLKAKQAGDPMGVLTALGFTYNDVVKRILETEAATTKKQEQPEPQKTETRRESVLPPELESEINQMRNYIAQQQRRELLTRVKETLPADKFKLIAGHEDYEGVIQLVNEFHAETGTLPGNTFEESVIAAAEALERKLSVKAEKWRKVLTPAQTAAIVQSEAQREPQSSGEVTSQAAKTLTNSVAAPAPTKPEPKNRDEVISDLLKDPEFLNSL